MRGILAAAAVAAVACPGVSEAQVRLRPPSCPAPMTVETGGAVNDETTPANMAECCNVKNFTCCPVATVPFGPGGTIALDEKAKELMKSKQPFVAVDPNGGKYFIAPVE